MDTHSSEVYALGNMTVVIGAGSGIGREIAHRCLEFGQNTVLADINLDYWSQYGISTDRYLLDVLDHKSVTDLCGWLRNCGYQVDGLVFTVGRAITLPIQSVKPSMHEESLQLNLVSFLNVITEFLNAGLFSSKGASILVISSIVGEVGAKGKTVYASSKGGIISAVRSLALELADINVRINAISPGTVHTEMLDKLVSTIGEDAVAQLAASYPLGLGFAGNVADLAYFLLGPQARWSTGSVITIDGGFTAG